MAILSSELVFYLTGAASDGGAQSDPDASLGNYRSSTTIISGALNNLFDNVTGDEASAGDTEYRCICIKNTNASLTLSDVKIWIQTDTGNAEDDISFAVEVPTGGDTDGYAQTIADESTAPTVNSGNVSDWSDATDKTNGLGVNQGSHDANLDAGEIVFVWIRRTISAGASAVSNETFTLRIEGDSPV
jgi:hypothetical protein